MASVLVKRLAVEPSEVIRIRVGEPPLLGRADDSLSESSAKTRVLGVPEIPTGLLAFNLTPFPFHVSLIESEELIARNQLPVFCSPRNHNRANFELPGNRREGLVAVRRKLPSLIQL